jgi:hypothetical protein
MTTMMTMMMMTMTTTTNQQQQQQQQQQNFTAPSPRSSRSIEAFIRMWQLKRPVCYL